MVNGTCSKYLNSILVFGAQNKYQSGYGTVHCRLMLPGYYLESSSPMKAISHRLS
jgi:hypothetical protein